MKHRETQARKTYEDAQRAVIQACEDLREAEMFLDSFERSERSAVGGAAARVVSSADIANTHASNIRESAVGGAAAEYLARDGQQACESRVPDRSNECSVSLTVTFSQADLESVLLALHSSSSVRCGGCTASCGLAGVTHLTGEGAIRGADGSSSSASSSAYSCGAEGDRGLPGASAHTPAGHTVQVSKYKIFARPEGGVRRG